MEKKRLAVKDSGNTISHGGGSGIYRRTNRQLLKYYGKDKRRVKMCLSKIGYDTEFGASVASSKLNLDYYLCEYCPHYHLTSIDHSYGTDKSPDTQGV